jgi:hypothetical protein
MRPFASPVIADYARLTGRMWARLSLVVAIGIMGCAKRDRDAASRVYVRVERSPGEPLAGAVVGAGDLRPTTTNKEGRAMLTLVGKQGQRAELTVRCPEGYRSPPGPVPVTLERFEDDTKAPEYEYTVRCPPIMRRIVVAVRADNGSNLPVLCMNQVVARTDVAGAAHFTAEVSPGARFEVSLDTSDRPELHPQNPSTTFSAPEDDAVLLFDQPFEVSGRKNGRN